MKTRAATLVLASLLLTACAVPPPPKPHDICHIFNERSDWMSAALSSEKRWNISASILMAFVHQESSFVSDARPPTKKERFLWFIPVTRYTSSAYGYAQALDVTWKEYEKAANRTLATRTNFRDSIDFIAWYNDRSARALGIKRKDAYNLYLAYHEGIGGYKRKTYKKKPQIMKAAKRVARIRTQYASQLRQCADRLPSTWYIPNLYL